MGEFMDKIRKVADVAADIMSQEESTVRTVNLFTDEDFMRFCKKNIKQHPEIEKCTLAVSRTREFDQMVFSEYKYVIRVLFLDFMENPILAEGGQQAYLGLIVIASGIDRKLKERMGDAEKKTMSIKGR